MGTAIFNKFSLDCPFEEKAVLNIGCGYAKFTQKNVVNLDAFSDCSPDVLCDLEGKMPFHDEQFDIIIANHVFEHIHNWWGCFEECSRVLKVGGKMIVFVPGQGNDSQFGYRDHVSVVNLYGFHGIIGTHHGTNAWAVSKMNTPASSMKLTGIEKVFYKKPWIRYAPKFLRFWMAEHLRNIVDEEGYYFVKVQK